MCSIHISLFLPLPDLFPPSSSPLHPPSTANPTFLPPLLLPSLLHHVSSNLYLIFTFLFSLSLFLSILSLHFIHPPPSLRSHPSYPPVLLSLLPSFLPSPLFCSAPPPTHTPSPATLHRAFWMTSDNCLLLLCSHYVHSPHTDHSCPSFTGHTLEISKGDGSCKCQPADHLTVSHHCVSQPPVPDMSICGSESG